MLVSAEISGKWGDITLTCKPNHADIAELITFNNAHLVAQALTSNPEAARALHAELSYWVDNNQI